MANDITAKTMLISIQIDQEVDRRVLSNIMGAAVADIMMTLKYTSRHSDNMVRTFFGREVHIDIEIE